METVTPLGRFVIPMTSTSFTKPLPCFDGWLKVIELETPQKLDIFWLVVLTILKNISQWEG
jgi:hypothetical protein